MFKNYLKVALRNLWKNRLFSGIGILGLSIAFGVATLLTMDSLHELSYDNFHTNGDRIYQVHITWQTPKGTEVGTSQPTPFAEALAFEVPGVEKITRFLEEEALTIYNEKELGLDAIYVDPDFFEMFSFPILQGTKKNTLVDVSSVVLTKSSATKLFGSESPVGKTVTVLINGKNEPFVVRAVAPDQPENSSIEFDIALPFEKNPEYEETKEHWYAQYHEVYLQLEEQVYAKTFEENSRSFTNLHYEGAVENLKRDGALPNQNGDFLQLGLLPITNKRFVRYNKGYVEISRAKVYVVLGVALLILFIACVNFVNMSIAKSAQRLREIGMRKTLGAEKRQLFFQFWGESLIVFIISLGIGVLLSLFLEDNFQTLFKTGATFDILLTPILIFTTLLLVLLISLIVGGYPALLLSRLTTIQSLKGKLGSSGKNHLRDGLIILQFGIAILLISGTFILNGQIEYMRNKDLGYDKEQVVSFPLNGKKNSYDTVKLLREELKDNQDILAITAADNNLGRGKDGSLSSSVWGFDYKGKSVRTNTLVVDYDYVKTLGLDFKEGRSFDFERENDAYTVIINESMAKELEEHEPLTVQLPAGDSLGYAVIGVVKDYIFQDISKAIEPLTIFLNRESGLTYAYVRVAPSNMADSFLAIQNAYKKIEPNAEFLGSFLDENVDRTFRREKTMAALVTSGSIIAILLSCVGLFAMSMLITNQRIKEIGIRKVIGASVASVTYLLTKDFLKLVLVAFVIATPISWWLANEWLKEYANRVDLSWHFFAVSGVLALLIAVLTISTKTIKSALANPVKSLRTE
ncbi:ABC transporter permease [Flagellimonas meridianipacifica]|uniref:ABC-type lipoprotein release transport system permease subunit n=1 Tax=Flagellimonas meridianipacifica TaxID=1080225 RepID=A0A2T0MGY8_9FLAO|nr:ABC transporter permease [Allomuricauda pacifica]PRX56839.1 ABC-type lipoprotein release transport system permease subunit [Allomuricauda pacifica]